jgi:hypothetical protein
MMVSNKNGISNLKITGVIFLKKNNPVKKDIISRLKVISNIKV